MVGQDLKKRVSKFLSKPLNKSSDVVHFLYCSDDRNILGDYCQSFEDPITSYMLEKITNNPNEVVNSSYRLNIGAVLEIFRYYKKKNNHSLSTFKTWLLFLSHRLDLVFFFIYTYVFNFGRLFE